jgi:polysaccharide deacetylase 2 family uncharacterized protein YibQ
LAKGQTKRTTKKGKKRGRWLPLFQWMILFVVVVLTVYFAWEILRLRDRRAVTQRDARRVVTLLARQRGWTLLTSTWVDRIEGREKWTMAVTTWKVAGPPQRTLQTLSKSFPQVRLEKEEGGWSYYRGSMEILRLLIVPAGQGIKERKKAEKIRAKPRFRVAIVIDDMGYRMDVAQAFLDLPWPITFSILPFTPEEKEIARLAREKGKDVMLHIPMAANGKEEAIERLESRTLGMLRVSMSDGELRRLVRQEIQEVPYAKGANNHMGSWFTRDPRKMRIVLEELKVRGYYFLDSLTDSRSVAYRVASRLGMKCFRRDVFLDNSKDVPYILHQLYALGCLARKRGYAVAIGHPSRATLLALRQGLPKLEKRGIKVVPLSEL